MDVEQASAQIDVLIDRRARERSKANDLEAFYVESVRRFNERRRQANRWEWIRFFDRMAASHPTLATSYENWAEALLEDPGGGGGR